VAPVADAAALRERIADALGTDRPRVLIIGALGRVGTGAGDLCDALGLAVTSWDMAETAHGGPFPEVLEHEIFLNCILATPGVPVFVPASRENGAPRAWRDRRHRLRPDLGFLAREGL
jgi:saccharopine dehydrogenase (NAD+, L-lysine-forming)